MYWRSINKTLWLTYVGHIAVTYYSSWLVFKLYQLKAFSYFEMFDCLYCNFLNIETPFKQTFIILLPNEQ